jgi:hypothetical protein
MHITIPTNIVLDDPNKISYSIAWDPVTNINCSSYLKILHCKATVIHRLGSGLEASNFLLSLFWHKLKNQLQKGTKIQPPRENQCQPRGNQEIISNQGLTFHITTKLKAANLQFAM